MKAWLFEWFYGLQPRERWIVAIGAAAALLIVVWWSVASLHADIALLQSSVDTKQRLLIDVSRVPGAQTSTPVDDQDGRDQPLYLLVENTAGTFGLEPPRTRANGPSGVDVETATLAPAREPGFVNATLLLRRL